MYRLSTNPLLRIATALLAGIFAALFLYSLYLPFVVTRGFSLFRFQDSTILAEKIFGGCPYPISNLLNFFTYMASWIFFIWATFTILVMVYLLDFIIITLCRKHNSLPHYLGYGLLSATILITSIGLGYFCSSHYLGII